MICGSPCGAPDPFVEHRVCNRERPGCRLRGVRYLGMQKVVAPPYEGLQPVGGWTLGIGTDAVIGLSEPLS